MTPIETLDDANAAVLDRGQVIRVQPPAPQATVYFGTIEGEGWVRRKAGRDRWRSADIDAVRATIEAAIDRNDRSPVTTCAAIPREDAR